MMMPYYDPAALRGIVLQTSEAGSRRQWLSLVLNTGKLEVCA